MGKTRFLEVEKKRTVTVVRIILEKIDSAVLDSLAEELHALVDNGAIVLLDLGQVRYFFSDFLEVLLHVHKKLKGAGGKLALCSPQATVREILVTTRFHLILPIFADENEAVLALTA
jgi:anti-anti-sigma factor